MTPTLCYLVAGTNSSRYAATTVFSHRLDRRNSTALHHAPSRHPCHARCDARPKTNSTWYASVNDNMGAGDIVHLGINSTWPDASYDVRAPQCSLPFWSVSSAKLGSKQWVVARANSHRSQLHTQLSHPSANRHPTLRSGLTAETKKHAPLCRCGTSAPPAC